MKVAMWVILPLIDLNATFTGLFVLTKLWLIGCKIAKASAPDNNFLCVFFDDVDKREQEKK